MSNPQVAQLVKSGAILWVAPVGEALPAATTVGSGAAWGGNWLRCGYTQAPLTFAYTSEEEEQEVEEEMGAIQRLRVSEALTIETTLAEITAAYLQLACSNQAAVVATAPGAGTRGYETTGLGGVSVLTVKSWGFEGIWVDSSANSWPIRVLVNRATAMLNGPLTWTRKAGDRVGIAIQIKALEDTAQSAGYRLCTFQRVTAAGT